MTKIITTKIAATSLLFSLTASAYACGGGPIEKGFASIVFLTFAFVFVLFIYLCTQVASGICLSIRNHSSGIEINKQEQYALRRNQQLTFVKFLFKIFSRICLFIGIMTLFSLFF